MTHSIAEQLGRIWNQFVFKRRDVLGITRAEFDPKPAVHTFPYQLSSYPPMATIEDLPTRTLADLASVVGLERVQLRLAHPNITLFTATTEDDELAGFQWALHPDGGSLWHDCFEVQPIDALIFNSYTMPNHRRRRVFSELIHYGNGYLFSELENNRVLAIVETQNKPSRNAFLAQKLRPVGSSDLIKLFGKNILALGILEGRARQIHYVFRNEKSVRL